MKRLTLRLRCWKLGGALRASSQRRQESVAGRSWQSDGELSREKRSNQTHESETRCQAGQVDLQQKSSGGESQWVAPYRAKSQVVALGSSQPDKSSCQDQYSLKALDVLQFSATGGNALGARRCKCMIFNVRKWRELETHQNY